VPHAIEIKNLTKRFSGGEQDAIAVNDLSLSIPHGQVFGFLGPNGAGKTTTIKMICGLIEQSSGQVFLNGFHVLKQRAEAMRQIGVILEGARNIYWQLSAWENLLYYGRLKGQAGTHLTTQAEMLLKELDLWDLRYENVGAFSRGTQQKVAIACALVANPPIILLDEPTLGLDVHAARMVKVWIEKLAQEYGKTIVLTTHQLDIAEQLCDRVAIMQEGRLIADKDLPNFLALEGVPHSYQIKIAGELSPAQQELFDDVCVKKECNSTILSNRPDGKTEFHQLLDRVHKEGLLLLSAHKTQQPSLEEVFVYLTK